MTDVKTLQEISANHFDLAEGRKTKQNKTTKTTRTTKTTNPI